MPLFIKNKQYKDKADNLCALVEKLPSPIKNPAKVDFKVSLPLKTCCQREYLLRGSRSKVRYLGTGGMSTCLAIFIKNDHGEAFLAHIDAGVNIPIEKQVVWKDIFSKFTKFDMKFNVIFLGGFKPEIGPYSEVKITNLLKSLLEYANTCDLSIHIDQSHVLKLDEQPHLLEKFMVNCKTGDVTLLASFQPVPNTLEDFRKFRMFDNYSHSLHLAYSDMHGRPEEGKLTFSPQFIEIMKQTTPKLSDEKLATILTSKLKIKAQHPYQMLSLLPQFRHWSKEIIKYGVKNFQVPEEKGAEEEKSTSPSREPARVPAPSFWKEKTGKKDVGRASPSTSTRPQPKR